MPAADSGRGIPVFLCVVAIVVLASLFSASAVSNIALGSKLLPSDTLGWVSSPNPTFRLSFYNNPANSDTFSVGVLYNSAGINSTVAWTAGGDIKVGNSGSFQLSSAGNLILRNDSVITVWNSSTGNMGVAAGSMGDDGNFILLNKSGAALWQTFDTPTDTLVVGQRLQQGASLTAGEYSASWQASSGNLTLSYTGNDGYTYWSSETATGNVSVYASLINASFTIYNAAEQALKSWYSKDYTTPPPEPIRRVTLDLDGNLRIYTTSSAGNWVIGWEALEDYCQIYAYCGPYGLCGYNETGLICKCATTAGYALIDEKNPRSGCRSIAGSGGQNCNGQSAANMVELNHTLLFISGTQNRNFRYGDAECSQTCLLNSGCTASTAFSDGSGTCQTVLSSNFFSGNQELSISTNSYFKFCGSNVPPAAPASSSLGPPSSGGGKGGRTVAVASAVSVLATLAVLAIGQVCIWWVCCRKNPRWGGYSAHYALMEYASGAPVQFTYRELRKATRNFNEKLGEGGFGAVYKGELPTMIGAAAVAEVAVKRLEGLADQGEKQFRMEVAVIGSTHHMNLVRLCGFCAEGKHRLLVYEYMRKGSLDKYLFAGEGEGEGDGGKRLDMDWETRYCVLLGTARGITYLHQECRDCIIHSDIKPENILLDGTFTAKVSDFGLARLTRSAAAAPNASGRHITTLVRGTRGYLAPEWRSNLPITVKADVFSFGMVVLETVSGRKSFDASASASASRYASFAEWAYRQFFLHKQVDGVVDERIKDEVDMEQLERAMKVAYWCVQVQPSLRPSMSKVIQILDGSMQDTQIPPMPKSFGDYMTNVNNQEESNVSLSAFEQESSIPSSNIALTSYESTGGYTPSSHSSFSRPPSSHNLSQSLIKHQTPPDYTF